MTTTPWKPTLLAALLALGLAGCGNGDDDAAPAEATEATQEQEVPAEATQEMPAEASSGGTEEGAPAMDEQPAGEPLEADAETLGESPEVTLDEQSALPGEATREDVDAIIEETERRFQEAQQRIDEQFQQAEQAPSVPEPMAGDDLESSIDIDTSLGDDPLADEGTGRSDIDAIIAEQERRFEEAQRKLEQQFEEMEREVPEFDGFDPEPMDSGAAASAAEGSGQ